MFASILIGVLCILGGVVWLIISVSLQRGYNETTEGIVVDTKWVTKNHGVYPIAVVEFQVDGQSYLAKQRFRAYLFSSKRTLQGKQERYWEVDTKYRIHYHVTSGPFGYAFAEKPDPLVPNGTKMEVYYSRKRPKHAYCGVRVRFYWMSLIFWGLGIFLIALGFIF